MLLENFLDTYETALRQAMSILKEQALYISTVASAFEDLQRNVSEFTAKNKCLKQLKKSSWKKQPLALKKGDEKLDNLYATIPSGMVGIAIQVVQHLT